MALVALLFLVFLAFVLFLAYASIYRSKHRLVIVAILFILLFLGLLSLVLYDSLNQLEKIKDYSVLGPFGDYIGGILNPLISVFAVFAAGFAFYAQYQANRLVQVQFEKQEKKDYIQNFENKFFNLLNIHHQIVSDVDLDSKKFYHFKGKLKKFIAKNGLVSDAYTTYILAEEKFVSRDVFKFTFNILDYLICIDKWIEENKDGYIDDKEEDVKKFFGLFQNRYSIKYNENTILCRLPDIYNLIYDEVGTDFGHYFRNVYRMLKIIDSSNFSSDKIKDYKIKYEYSSILRAQLSDFEIRWIFLNCLTELGNEKLKPLLEKYCILKVIPFDFDHDDSIFYTLAKLYSKTAFIPMDDNELALFLEKKECDHLEIIKIVDDAPSDS